MNRLNDKIAENREKKTKLDNENYNIESEFIEKLKDMEKESVYLEVFYCNMIWLIRKSKIDNKKALILDFLMNQII